VTATTWCGCASGRREGAMADIPTEWLVKAVAWFGAKGAAWFVAYFALAIMSAFNRNSSGDIEPIVRIEPKRKPRRRKHKASRRARQEPKPL
jgi:hypothetical protein